jgi:hypothetical protein
MNHRIEFNTTITVDLEVSPAQRLERLRVRAGERVTAALHPYIVEMGGEPVEVADLYLEDGTTARRVPFAWFRFVD